MMRRQKSAWPRHLLSCWPAPSCPASMAVPRSRSRADFEVVTSVPPETTISGAGTRAAAAVWPEMISGARHTLDIAEFYLASEKGEALEPVVEAVLAAGRRGVKVRILSDAAMAATYPETLARFQGRPNILTRLFDWKKFTGGILHAKYFVVDGREAFVGSQNFDWRALAHIQETGLRIRVPLFARGPAAHLRRRLEIQRRRSAGLSRSGAAAAPGFSGRRPPCGQPGCLQPARGRRGPGSAGRGHRRRPQPRDRAAAFLQPRGRRRGEIPAPSTRRCAGRPGATCACGCWSRTGTCGRPSLPG